ARIVVGASALLLIPFAIFWSRGYLLSRSKWRGIRFALSNNAAKYAKMMCLAWVTGVLTLGCTAPLFIHEARRVMIGSTRYGTESFRYDGEPRDLLIIYLRGILLSILTIGIYIPWMRAQEQRYIWGRTFFMNAQGHCDLSGWLLLRLTLLNLLGS